MNPYQAAILFLVSFNASLHVAHWSADTVTNEHKALGDLYDAMDGLTDSFAETAISRIGTRAFPNMSCDIVRPYPQLIEEALEVVKDLFVQCQKDNAQDLLNITADMQAALNKAKYFLRL